MTDDERVVLDFHPHWTTLLRALLIAVLIVIVAGAAIVFLPDFDQRTNVRLIIAAVAVVAILVFTLAPWVRWFTTRYVLTTHRLTLREGVFSRSGRDIPIARINDVSFSHNLIERMLGAGTLTVESAGERGQIMLKNVPRVQRVQRELYTLMEDWADGRYDGPAGSAPTDVG